MLLSSLVLFGCTAVENSSNISEAQIKQILSGSNGKKWILGIQTQDCTFQPIGSNVEITIYPSGKYEGISNLCDWSIRIEKSPVHYQAYLVLANNTYKILPNPYQDNFYIYDESTSTYKLVTSGGQVASNGTVTDIDGNIYPTKFINGKNWMLENLKTTKYSDGTQITQVANFGIGGGAWDTMGVNPGMTWKNNDPVSMKTNGVGAYYNFHAVTTNKLCPTGWHVGGDADWNNLITYAGGDAVAGTEIKSIAAGGTNSTEFNGLITGIISETGQVLPDYGMWWINVSVNTINAKTINVSSSSPLNVEPLDGDKRSGLSVRCVQN